MQFKHYHMKAEILTLSQEIAEWALYICGIYVVRRMYLSHQRPIYA